MDKFVNLHNHSEFSILDGFSHVQEYLQRAWELGQPAVGLTDHGNLYGTYKFLSGAFQLAKNKSKKNKPQVPIFVKPIPGVEAYVAPLNPDGARAKRPIHYGTPNQKRIDVSSNGAYLHLTLLAYNDTGYHNLIKLISEAGEQENFYKKSRIDMDMLERYHEGLIAFTGCPSGEISTRLRLGQTSKAYDYARRMMELFPGRYYVELMNHSMTSDIEREAIPKLVKLGDGLNLPLIVTNDSHYACKEDARHQEEMLASQSGSSMYDVPAGQPKPENQDARATGRPRFVFDGREYYLKDYEAMIRLFPEDEYKDAVTNTVNVSNLVHISPDSNLSSIIGDGLVNMVRSNADPDETLVRAVSMIGEVQSPESIKQKVMSTNVDTSLDDDKLSRQLESLFEYDDGISIAMRHDLRPTVLIPEGYTEAAWFQKQINDGFKKKLIDTHASDEMKIEAKKRIAHEYPVFANNNFIQYMLVVQDYIKFARKAGVDVGPARGSAGGSEIANLMDITRVDPIKNDLIFERFLNPERLSPPDVDTDFAASRKEEVLNYVINKYGDKKIANVTTFQTFKARTAWLDMARIYRIPISESVRIKELIPNDSKVKFADLYDKENKYYEEAAEFRAAVEEHPKVWAAAKAMEGRVKTTSVHPCAVIMSDVDITDVAPTVCANRDDIDVKPWGARSVQWEYAECEALGLIKMDFLSLSDLDVVSWTLDNIKHDTGKTINLDDITKNMDDKATYEMLGRGDTMGVFQLSSDGYHDLMIRINPTGFDDINAALALYRPGPMDMNAHIDYADAKNHRIKVVPLDPSFRGTKIEQILDYTYQKIVYQEQVMQISQQAAGFTMGQADALRSAMGHKKIDVMLSMKSKFIDGCVKNGYNKEAIEKLWAHIERFSAYAFNKAHSAAYGQLSYITAWLKCHYPAEFMAAFMTDHMGQKDKLAMLISDCANRNLKITGIDINESAGNITSVRKEKPSDPDIALGFNMVNGISDSVSSEIVAYRERHGKFKSLDDFMSNLPAKLLSPKLIKSLAEVGAFDSLGVNRRALDVAAPEIVKYYKNIISDKEKGQASIFDVPGTLSHKPFKLPPAQDWSFLDKLKIEKKNTGSYISARPLDNLGPGLKYLQQSFDKPYIPLKELAKKDTKASFRTIAYVPEIGIFSNKKGNSFIRLTMEDGANSINAIAFSKNTDSILEKNTEGLLNNEVYLIDGDCYKDYRNRTTYAVTGLVRLDLTVNGRIPLWIKLTEQEYNTQYKSLLKELSKLKGDIPVFVTVQSDDGTVKTVDTKININDSKKNLIELENTIGGKRLGIWI